jgi:hypothetical protein
MKLRRSSLGLGLAVALAAAAWVVSSHVPTVSAQAKPVVTVSGRITSDTVWTSDNDYLLRGAVFVDDGATLTIHAGTRVVGEKSSIGTLIIARGAKIQANGTREAPIVLTSDQPEGRRARGDWGGLILNGNAPINAPGGTAEGEGDTGIYGGGDPNDRSGGMQYMRVEFAGIEFSPDNELNGVAFQGVGAGTTADYMQVHFNKDDSFEFFGGTVSVKHLVSTAAGDDNFDWTDGWTGRAQFLVAQQKGDDADQGFECDNNGENNDLLPRADPTIYNATVIGAPGTEDGDESDIGMLLRAGTAGRLYNIIILGFKEWGIEIDNSSTFAQANAGALFVRSAIVHGNGFGSFSDDAKESPSPTITTAQFARTVWENISEENPQLRDPFNLESPDWRPADGSPALTGAVPVSQPPDDGFFEPVNFIGGVGADDWTAGWTTHAQN